MAGKVIDIVKRAMVMVGAIDAQATPGGGEADMCLAALRDLIPALPGWGGWTEIEINRDYAPLGEDYRIAVIGDVEIELTLPELVWDDVSISYDGDGMPVETGTFLRAPRDGARIRAYSQASGQTVFYAYCADDGQWRSVIGLDFASDVPVSSDMHGHLVALLGEQIAPVFGVPLSGEAERAVSRARLAWVARYDRRKRVVTPANRAEAVGGYM